MKKTDPKTREKSAATISNNGAGGGGKRERFTTRHLAALDFLRNIQMVEEPRIVEKGLSQAKRIEYSMNGLDGDDDMEDLLQRHMLSQQQQIAQDPSYGDIGADTTAVGRKLQGRSAATMRVPLQFRYQLVRLTDSSAVVRNWEEQLIRSHVNVQDAKISNSSDMPIESGSKGLLQSRMFCSRARAYPMAVFSVIASPYW